MPATVAQQLRWSEQHLLRQAGVGALSNIERWHLRRIVEQCAAEFDRDIPLVRQEKMDGAWLVEPEIEAPRRWLRDLYGVEPCLSNFEIGSGTQKICSPEFKEWLARERERVSVPLRKRVRRRSSFRTAGVSEANSE